VEMDAAGDVWYEIRAYLCPQHWLARLGYPFTRSLQHRFARDSAAAMQAAVNYTLRGQQ